MKRIILSVMVLAFAVAVQAGDDKACQDKDKAGCCASKVQTSLQATTSQDNEKPGCCANKVKTSLEATASQGNDKPGCCASKVQTSLEATTSQDTEKAGCCAGKVKTSNQAQGSCPFAKGTASRQAPAKQTALLSPKAAADASK